MFIYGWIVGDSVAVSVLVRQSKARWINTRRMPYENESGKTVFSTRRDRFSPPLLYHDDTSIIHSLAVRRDGILSLLNSTIVVEGNNSVFNVSGSLYLQNTSILCGENITYSIMVNGFFESVKSVIRLGWELTGLAGSAMELKDTEVYLVDLSLIHI